MPLARATWITLAVWIGVVGAVHAQEMPRGRDAAALARTHRVRPRAWTAIIVHHTASSGGSGASIDAYHREVRRMPRGLAYHFVIGNGRGLGDGEIEVGPRWTRQQPGAHVASSLRDPDTRALWDEVAIGISLVGNFETFSPSRAQLAALRELVEVLRRRYRIPAERVLGHGDLAGAHTLCPGRTLRAAFLTDRDARPARRASAARVRGGRGGPGARR